MERIGVLSKRMQGVREQYLLSPVAQRWPIPAGYGNHELSIYWLEGYIKAKRMGETTLLRRSFAEKAELENSRVIITENELIVGQCDLEPFKSRHDEFMKLYEMYTSMAANIDDDGRSDHTALDYEKLLSVGVDGLIKEITEQKAKLTFDREHLHESLEKEEFYEACLIELEALLNYAERYEQKLRELAETADGARRDELLTMADNLRQVPRYPAKTFWQALQSIHFYTFNLRGLYSAGRPDQYLLPYYETDIKNGVITEEFAQELMDNFCLLYSTYINPGAAVGMMVGGTDSNGNTVENPLTWGFLRAVDAIQMADPNLGLCVTENTTTEILQYSMDMIGRGRAFPAFWNDRDVVKGMIANGFPKKDAHRYINSTCVELSVIGKSNMWTTAPYHNLAQIFRDVFISSNYESQEDFENAAYKAVYDAIIRENHRINRLKLERYRNASEPMRHSCLIADCIKRGKHVGNGGAIYNTTLPNILGFANFVDSMMAVRELVYKQNKLTLEEFKQAVENNFDGFEELRQTILNKVDHYGNNKNEVDLIAKTLADTILKACGDAKALMDAGLVPGIFSFNYHIMYGKNTLATPDGRLAGAPLSDSAGPAQGRDVNSPTAAILSATVFPQTRFLGGIAQNIRLSKKLFADKEKAIPISLLRTFIERGGCELQINCVDSATLEKAIENPEDYRDLMVRIGGYCDFFTKQPLDLQKEIASRTDYE